MLGRYQLMFYTNFSMVKRLSPKWFIAFVNSDLVRLQKDKLKLETRYIKCCL